MKKLFILAIALCTLCSCSITSYSIVSCYGNITTFTQQGDTLKVYNNVLIKETVGGYNTTNVFKNFGLNFTDSTGKGIVIGHAVPYIIEYDVNKIIVEVPDYYEEDIHDNPNYTGG